MLLARNRTSYHWEWQGRIMNEDIKPSIRPLKDSDGLVLAGTTKTFRDLLDEKSSDVFFCAHVGPSMNPTLCTLDLLEVVPYSDRRIKVGDVIIFIPPERVRPVVHRVVGITPEGIRTRGDNNNNDDAQLLQPADIAGRVVAAQRGQKRRKVFGGRFGRVVARLTRWRCVFDRGISRLLHPIYRLFTRLSIFRHLLPTRLRPRVVISQTRDRNCLRLLMGKRVVGYYDACQDQWRIRRPFRLFVDEPALPRIRSRNLTTD